MKLIVEVEVVMDYITSTNHSSDANSGEDNCLLITFSMISSDFTKDHSLWSKNISCNCMKGVSLSEDKFYICCVPWLLINFLQMLLF